MTAVPSHSLDVLTRLPLAVPGALVTLAEAWTPGAEPAVPQPSASVVLVRPAPDGPAGLETYLLHRHARMSFAASMVVFPGGRVDPLDLAEPDPVRACAVRETAEETGVLLDPGDLHDWAHWTTPEVEPRRYDTHFFVAVLPGGQRADDLSGETERAGWERPEVALAASEHGRIALMPPTRSMLLELADAGSVEAVLAQAKDRVVQPVLPRVVRSAEGWRFDYSLRTGP